MAQVLEFTEFHTPDGELYRFQTGDKFLLSESGYGMPPINYITQKGPFQHGETVYDYRLGPRIIQLVHRRNACSRTEYWENRADLLDMIRPNRYASGFAKGTLRKRLPDGTVRDIDVVLEQGPVFQPRDLSRWDEWGFTETLRFIAHEPSFYDPTSTDVTPVLDDSNHLIFQEDGAGTRDIIFATTSAFRLLSGSTEYGLPGLVFSSDALLEVNETINYTGTWRSYPTITIEGPIATPWIVNVSSGRQIRLSYTVAYGETVVIALPFGNKTVTSDVYGNIIGSVDTNSDLSEFAILPDGEVASGTNVIVFAGSNVDSNTSITLNYYTRYIGI